MSPRTVPTRLEDVEPLVAAHATALCAAFDAGRAEHPHLAPVFETFATTWLRLVLKRLAALGLPPTTDRVAATIRSAAVTDLYLAAACEQGVPGSWEALMERLVPRLEALAKKRGAAGDRGAIVVAEMLGDLSLRPPRADSRTLIGTFDGSGSLFAWLAVVLVRRLADAARQRRPSSFDAGSDGEPPHRLSLGASTPPADPAESALDAETTGRFERALAEAWRDFTPRERLALLLRYREGLAQRGVAAVLGVGEPRASRLLAQARRKLAASLHAHGEAPTRERDWALLRDAVARELARLGEANAPRVGGSTVEGHDAT